MAGKDISVKKYVVRLSAGEREHLQALIRKGKSPAKRLLKARILLKADVSRSRWCRSLSPIQTRRGTNIAAEAQSPKKVAALLRDYDIRPVVVHPTKRADLELPRSMLN